MLSWGKIIMRRKHLVKTLKIYCHELSLLSAFITGGSSDASCASVCKWNNGWPIIFEEGCSLTYSQAVSFVQTRKSSNLRNQWLSLPVLRKPLSFLLADEICTSELACCWFWVNELESMNSLSANPNLSVMD